MGEVTLYQAFIYLLAAVVCVPIAKRLGMGSVLGYLLAGMLIGPFVLGKYIGMSSGDEVHDIMHAAEFGVVMMLFLIGLELDPKDLWKMRKKILGVGGVQLFGTVLLVIPISLHYVSPSKGTAIAIGAAVAMSSTAIIMQTLSERGLTKTPSGKSSFSVLLFQDIMVIPILAVLPLLAAKSVIVPTANLEGALLDGAPGWMKTLAIVSAIGLIFFVGNYIVNPFFKYIARLQVSELFTSSALMLVIGVSVLMNYVGLSPALGAFMAGVALANSEFRHQLESDIEPFKALLLGLFFIAVGSTINFKLIIHEPTKVLALTFGVILIKGVVLLITGFIFRLKLNQNVLFAILLSQIGEFAFVILSISLQLQLIPKEWTDLLFATTALTMTITPLFLVVNEKWIVPMMGMIKIKAGGFQDDPEYSFEDLDSKKIIIAGYGDFGNTVGRLIKFSGFSATVLDKDSDRIELLRKLGYNVYYGDATNLNTLRAAKADKADILIAALDPPEANRRLIELASQNFPNLKIFIRTRNRYDAYNYLNKGYTHIYRENFNTAVQLGVDVLEELGFRHKEAVQQGEIFTIADNKSVRKLSKYSQNLEEYISASKEEMEKIKISLRRGQTLENLDLEDEPQQPTFEKKYMSQKQRILVFRFSSMGDVAMCVPVVREFLEQFPETEILFVSRPQFQPMFEGIENLKFFPADLKNKYKGVFGLYKLSKDLRATGFDAVADLHNVLRTQIVRKFLNPKKIEILDKARKERSQLVRQNDKIKKQLKPMTERYADVFKKLGFDLKLSNRLVNHSEKENAVGIAPFAMYEGKQYPFDRMKTVALKIAEKGMKVYLFGSKAENQKLKEWQKLNPNIVSVAGKYDLKKELEIISRLKLMVSMDSANMHLASIVGTPVVSIWGTTHPFMGFLGYGQDYENVIQDESLIQRPTSVYGKEPKSAPKIDYFKNISPEMIVEKIEKFL